MPNFDLCLITTVTADTYEDACDWLRDFADGLSDNEGMPFTSEYPGMARETLIGRERMFFLLPLTPDGASLYDGPTQGPEDEDHVIRPKGSIQFIEHDEPLDDPDDFFLLP